jgi:peroxiredoxin family protein
LVTYFFTFWSLGLLYKEKKNEKESCERGERGGEREEEEGKNLKIKNYKYKYLFKKKFLNKY